MVITFSAFPFKTFSAKKKYRIIKFIFNKPYNKNEDSQIYSFNSIITIYTKVAKRYAILRWYCSFLN